MINLEFKKTELLFSDENQKGINPGRGSQSLSCIIFCFSIEQTHFLFGLGVAQPCFSTVFNQKAICPTTFNHPLSKMSLYQNLHRLINMKQSKYSKRNRGRENLFGIF